MCCWALVCTSCEGCRCACVCQDIPGFRRLLLGGRTCYETGHGVLEKCCARSLGFNDKLWTCVHLLLKCRQTVMHPSLKLQQSSDHRDQLGLCSQKIQKRLGYFHYFKHVSAFFFLHLECLVELSCFFLSKFTNEAAQHVLQNGPVVIQRVRMSFLRVPILKNFFVLSEHISLKQLVMCNGQSPF